MATNKQIVHFYKPGIDQLTTKCREFIHAGFLRHSKYKNRVTCEKCLKWIKENKT